MQATYCKSCGARHAGTCAEYLASQRPKPAVPETPAKSPPSPAKPLPQDDSVRAYERRRKAAWRERNREAYNARQREIMRARRR